MDRLDEILRRSRAAESDAGAWHALLAKCARDMQVATLGKDFSALYRNAKQTFIRTLHGYSTADAELKAANDARAIAVLHASLSELAVDSNSADTAFDSWHARTCGRLREAWNGPCALTVGQAQKLVNVLLKSILTLPDSEHGLAAARWTRHLHVPIDNQTRALLAELDRNTTRARRPSEHAPNWSATSWSRISDYDRDYLPLQLALRDWARGERVSPISVDLVGWRPGE
ncbi:MAG: hypothetical protein JNN27_08720 [Planctomycetes bacterium]|nr:hypothetical protein [Planctomycetota bacterium]